MTTAMAAEKLGMSQDYIRRLCQNGQIKAEKVGHDWIFTEMALKNIQRKRSKPKKDL